MDRITPILCTYVLLSIEESCHLTSSWQPITRRNQTLCNPKPNGWTPASRKPQSVIQGVRRKSPTSQDHGVERRFRGKHRRGRLCCLLPHK
ncbi:hypothetical protein TNCV_271291 [Trichonephila clavipes]|nr:hypothetical protein TNCV_271291 [Trichonephila clavipes]